jgi:hypothetical protein
MSRPTIAIVGASADRRKFGNKAVRAYQAKGYDVYPVHPKAASIEGLPAYPSLLALPVRALERVSIYLPRDPCLTLLPELAQLQVKEVWFNPGADHPDVLAKAQQLGIPAVIGCSIVALGVSPSMFPDEGAPPAAADCARP